MVPKAKKSKQVVKMPKKEDEFANIYKAIGVLTDDCGKTRNEASISVSKCYASNTALVELLIAKGVLEENDKEIYLFKSLKHFHKATLKDIGEALAELESGKSITTENVVDGLREEKEFNEEIVRQIVKAEQAIINGKKSYADLS